MQPPINEGSSLTGCDGARVERVAMPRRLGEVQVPPYGVKETLVVGPIW